MTLPQRPMQTTIVACSADVSHEHDKCVGLNFVEGNVIQGVDYLSFLHPGAYPVDESLDALIDVVNRYGSKHVCIITHSNCGLVASSHALAHNTDNIPEFFPNYTRGVLTLLEENGISHPTVASMDDHGVAQVLAYLIVTRVSRHFVARDAHSDVYISAAISHGDGSEPESIIERTPVDELAAINLFANV